MTIQKLNAQNNGWTKKDFPNITLAGLESAIVVKRHLLNSALDSGIDVAPGKFGNKNKRK